MQKTHGKVCVCRAPRKNARQSLCLPCANAKTHGKYFFGRASLEKRTAKHLFAVRPKKYARQTFRRTANMEFPVVRDAPH
jgi:hypothetical protein